MGFDPMISTLKGWRPNLARRPGHKCMLLQRLIPRQRYGYSVGNVLLDTLRRGPSTPHPLLIPFICMGVTHVPTGWCLYVIYIVLFQDKLFRFR